ncbi:MAG: hypothetical protein NZM11_09595 [Anaerolineales bacterium]|nr:hypothetical protein [Anaerolineales bacterium]
MLAYREEYLIERNFGRLKGKPLSLPPMYLQDDRRATGLTRSLSLGLRVLTLIEHIVRRQLAQSSKGLRGLYAGNPTHITLRPTNEPMLLALKDISLVCVQAGRTELSPYHLLIQTPAAPLDFAEPPRKPVFHAGRPFLKSTLKMSEPRVTEDAEQNAHVVSVFSVLTL